jgi:hypothetical protein
MMGNPIGVSTLCSSRLLCERLALMVDGGANPAVRFWPLAARQFF